MSLATNLQNFATRVATETKTLRTLINGNNTDLGALTTSAKDNLVAAINEVAAEVDTIQSGGVATDLESLTDVDLTNPSDGHILRHNGAGQFVNVLGTSYFDAAGSAAAAQSASQPLDSDLTAIAALSTTAYGRALLELADQGAVMGLLRNASESATGIVELATTTETTTGTDTTRAVTPAGLRVVTDTKADTASLADIATSGDAGDLTGTLPTSVLPPLAVNEVFVVASQAEMLALTAQRGDVAIRTDNGNTYILATDSPTTLADWKEVTATGDVVSVAGKSGVVTLNKGDVGLANVDNTSDAAKPISTATQSALDVKQPLDATLTGIAGVTTAANQTIYSTGPDTFATTGLTAFGRSLIDDADASAGRTTLDVYSKGEIGNPEVDLVATFNAGLV